MKNKKILIPLLLFVTSFTFAKTTDLIKKVNLTQNRHDSLLVSDMFYSDKYEIEILPDNPVMLKYDSENNYLHFYVNDIPEGYYAVSIKNQGETLSFPVYVKKPLVHKFIFKPKERYNELTVFGEFNGWNRHKDYFTDADKDGIYEALVEIDPGKYQYKFYADGKELVDSNNPDSVNNGMGSYNSILTIKPPVKDYSFLHVDKFKSSGNNSVFSFYYERANQKSKLKSADVLGFVDNKLLDENNIHIQGNEISIVLDGEKLQNRHMLRVVVNKDGVSTNMQFVNIENGKPVTNNSSFSWYDGILYSLMIDRFANGDKSNDNPIVQDSLLPKANYNGGDLSGLIQKLQEGYFDSLGINTLWISPVYDNPNKAYREYPKPHRWFSGYHGYWPISSTEVDEHFGSLNDLKALIKIAHKHGIKVLLDFVSNHVHKEHPFFNEHRDWFGKLELPDGRLNLRLWDEQRLTTWFEPYLPSFDYVHSEEALDTMTSNAVWWLRETGADGFRHDAVKHVPYVFWRELTRKLKKEFPDKIIYQVGETFGNYDLVSSYVNNGQLSAQFNFNLYNIAQAAFIDTTVSFEELLKELHKTEYVYGPLHLMSNIMDSHDKNRYIAYADGDLQLWQWSAVEEGWNNPPKVDNPSSYKKAELYYAYMFGIPGLPVIYYGSEFGMSGASDPDNRRPMRFGDQLNNYEKEMLMDVRKIVKLRKNHTALRHGDFNCLIADENVLAFVRSDFNERILVVINNSKFPQGVDIKLPAVYEANKLIDLISGKTVYPERDNATVVVDGYGFRYLKIVK